MKDFNRLCNWGIAVSFAVMIIGFLLLLVTCSSHTDKGDGFGGWEPAWFEVKGDPVMLQKIAAGAMEPGVYRYIDRETGVAFFLVKSTDGSVAITSQKVAVK
jgi:hypothetical protein